MYGTSAQSQDLIPSRFVVTPTIIPATVPVAGKMMMTTTTTEIVVGVVEVSSLPDSEVWTTATGRRRH